MWVAFCLLIPPKKIIFRGYKKFDEQNFLHDLDHQMIKGKFYKEKNMCESFSDTFKAVVIKHALLKEKIIRRNKAMYKNRKTGTGNGMRGTRGMGGIVVVVVIFIDSWIGHT